MKRFLPLLAIAVLALIVLYALFFKAQNTSANPSRVTVCATHEATTTPAYMTAGNATTTLSCSIDGVDQVDLLIQFRASSTLSDLRYRYEYSRDGIDWYQSEHDFYLSASTSPVQLSSAFTEYSLPYASTTPETSGGNADTMFKRVQVKDLSARYMRVKFYLPPGSLNGAVYAEMLRKEQHR